MKRHTAALRRFAGREIDTANAVGLRDGHDALTEGRTLFPSTVVGSYESPRLLVSGHNNYKLGKEVTKGPRAGWPIFHLTLEERATCPRSCAQWKNCYGSAMPQARRHAVDGDFLWLLKAEVATVARQHPKGLLVRLHTLGDFYSVEYVLMWAKLLAAFPQLHVFGYTARRVDDADLETQRIARALALLTENMWDRFAIRTSHTEAGRQRSIVVDADPEAPGVIVCPAQTNQTEICGSCGLCWSPSARDKTIAFLRHGMTRNRGVRAPKLQVVKTVSTAAPPPQPRGRGGVLPPAMPAGSPQEPGYSAYQTASMSKVLDALKRGAKGGKITISFTAIGAAADVPHGSISFLLDSLAKRGLISITRGIDRRPNSYTVLDNVQARTPAAAPAPPAPPALPEQSPETTALRERIVRRPEPAPRPPTKALPAPVRDNEINLATARPAPAPRLPAPVEAPVARVMRETAEIDLSEAMEHEAPSAPGPRTLMTLRPGECHWPVGEASGGEQPYCGAKVLEGSGYCPKHYDALRGRSAKTPRASA